MKHHRALLASVLVLGCATPPPLAAPPAPAPPAPPAPAPPPPPPIAAVAAPPADYSAVEAELVRGTDRRCPPIAVAPQAWRHDLSPPRLPLVLCDAPALRRAKLTLAGPIDFAKEIIVVLGSAAGAGAVPFSDREHLTDGRTAIVAMDDTRCSCGGAAPPAEVLRACAERPGPPLRAIRVPRPAERLVIVPSPVCDPRLP